MRRAALPERHAWGMYLSLGKSLGEFLWMALFGNGRNIRKHADVSPSSLPLWEGLRRKGALILGTHTGNWDLAACRVAGERPLLVVTKHLRVGWLDRIWQSTRRRLGVLLCPGEGAVSKVSEVVRSHGAAVMMMDQVPSSERHAVVCPFLGADVWVDTAPALLGARLGIPLVLTAQSRTRHGHRLEILAIYEPPPRAGRPWARETMVDATRRLEHFVRAHPSEWLWLHRRWRDPRSEVLASPHHA